MTTAVPVAILTIVGAVPWRLTEAWWLETGVVTALSVATIAVVRDLTGQRIPDRVVLASLVPTGVVVVVMIGTEGIGAVPDVLLGAAAFAVPLLAAHLASPAALGFGDVKLAGSLGAALGLVDWRHSVVALCIASAITAAVALVRRRSEMPFAPGLVAGAALVLILATFEGSLRWR